MDRFLEIQGKRYTTAPLTMSPETIELLECAYDMQEDNSKAIKAMPLLYRILVDSMVRGGDVKDEDEAKKILKGVPLTKETIESFLTAMMGTAGAETTP